MTVEASAQDGEARNNVSTLENNPENNLDIAIPMNYDHMPSSSAHANLEGRKVKDLAQAFDDLCMACRKGDIETVDYLLSTPELDINQVDEWDYSPLILASLCGHIRVVELLLSRGAICDRDTFQGARCIYGALNDPIRDLLISYDISKKVDVSQPFASHISSFLNPKNRINNGDVVFFFPHGSRDKNEQVFILNRYLLAARSRYFQRKFNNRGAWSSKLVIEMPETTDPRVFRVIVDYMYLRTDSLPLDNALIKEQLTQMAIKLELDDLMKGIEKINKVRGDKQKSKTKHELSFMFVEKARKDLDNFLSSNILKSQQSSKIDDLETVDVEDLNSKAYVSGEKKLKLWESSAIPDVFIAVFDAMSDSMIYLPAHKSILSRSEYFETMFQSEIFASSEEELSIYTDDVKTRGKPVMNRPEVGPEDIAVIQISSSCSSLEVAKLVCSFMYHDDIPSIPLHHSIELLFVADELFLDRLKTMSAVRITSCFSKFTEEEFKLLNEEVGYDPYDLIRISWQTTCDKLEQHITKMISHNLHYIFFNQEQRSLFAELVKESASKISARQDLDTIELIDDIRFYLSKKYAVNEFSDFEPIGWHFREYEPNYKAAEDIKIYQSAMLKYEEDLTLIDSLLEDLGLGA